MSETSTAVTHTAPHRMLHPLPVGAAHWTAGFWAERFHLCHEVIVHSMQDALDEESNAARFSNFYVAAGLQEGEHKGAFWSDGDCYKWMEALSHLYGITRDPELDHTLDERITIVAKAQEPDGYINTQIQIPKKERYVLRNHHEEYNFGHLFTAACVHKRTTGKDNFLQIAIRAADLLWNVFSPRPRHLVHFGFNPSQIMGLVDLYRTTGERRYLELADIFVTLRGSAPEDLLKPPEYAFRGNGDQNQDRVPLRQETKGEGHVVTATYLYAGAADVYMETGDDALLQALKRIWTDASEHKTFITGGSALLHYGASSRNDPVHEAYGLPYHLHNASAYNETCATIGNAMWAWRMLGITGEAAYADAMERVVYNGMLSAISLDGKRFFYTNPLRWHASDQLMLSQDAHERWYTFKCYCCPPQVARGIAWMQDWAYSQSEDGVSVNLYGSSQLDIPWGHGEKLALRQETDYPWDGRVVITVEAAPAGPLAFLLRIPGWAKGAIISVNGQPAGIEAQPGWFARIERAWAAGDRVELDFPMSVRLVKAHPHVEEARNHVAAMRGPVVYCLEAADLPLGVTVPEVHMPRDIAFTARRDSELLGGAIVLEGIGKRIYSRQAAEGLYVELGDEVVEDVPIRLIPYYAWNNRGEGQMSVWLPLA